MNQKILNELQAYYEELEVIDFSELFINTYMNSTTSQRLALVIHFMNNWFDADYVDLPRRIAEIK